MRNTHNNAKTNAKDNNENPFDKFSSSVDKITIPLKKFSYFHRPSEPGKLDPYYIEKKKNYYILKEWITNNKSNGGSYLITGYRGAGKSSFVGKVLNDIFEEREETRIKKRTRIIKILALLLIAIGSIVAIDIIKLLIPAVFFSYSYYIVFLLAILPLYKIKRNKKITDYLTTVFFLLTACLICCICFLLYYKPETIFGYNPIIITRNILITYFIYIGFIYVIPKKVEGTTKQLLKIKINLGHETLKEKDILSLITSDLKEQYLKQTNSWTNFEYFTALRFILNLIFASFLYMGYYNIITKEIPHTYKYLENLRYIISGFQKYTEIENHNLFNIFLFILFLLLADKIRLWLTKFLHKKMHIPIAPIYLIQEKLEELTDRIESSVSIGQSNMPTPNKLFHINLGGKKSKTYTVASEREIEQELIRILDMIQENWLCKTQVVIILDELDKTDPVNSSYQEKIVPSYSLPEYERSTTITTGGATTQAKKTNVLSLIANMKFFLSSAQAHFIFIAGRELYDGFLADVSDRDFTINSIFNGVINIDSFLITSRKLNSLSALTEQFISRHIMGSYLECCKIPGFKKDGMEAEEQHFSFKRYYDYERLLLENAINDIENEEEYLQEKRKKRQRLKNELKELEVNVHFLYKFSVYLAYISNGSPKKISSFFEKYVRSAEYLKSTGVLSKKEKEENYYLTFGFYSQQRISFVYYLTYPVLQAIINRSNTYGDKLLVSATFIVSHIFKLYNNGFSWRNLEQTPELLENSRSPELREYIISIIDFLKSTHISEIHCGLYNYKFPMKTSEEITYHSKMSDEISALFNFSAEETQHIKQYYTRVLEMYTIQVENEKNNDPHVIANIHHILGDTYMNEENYSKAVYEYYTSISLIKKFLKQNISEEEKLFYYFYLLHTTLKLGLANERRHTDNSAYMVYTQLISILKEIKKKLPKTKEHCSLSTIFNKKDIIEHHHPLFNDMGMIYQPLLARLYCLEKTGAEGIRKEDISQVITDFISLHGKSSTKSNDRILEADFYRKLGDITYYKNFRELPGTDKECTGYSTCSHREGYKNKYNSYIPCNSCYYYKKSLLILLAPFERIKYDQWREKRSEERFMCKKIRWAKPFSIFEFFYQLFLISEFKDKLLGGNSTHLFQIAVTLELTGNTHFSCSNNKDKLRHEFIQDFLSFIKDYNTNTYKNDESFFFKAVEKIYNHRQKDSHLKKAILYYWCAAYCFNYAGNLNAAVRCYKQILVIINSYLTVQYKTSQNSGTKDIDWDISIIQLLEEQLINRALISLYSHYENSNILEIQEIKWRYSKEMFEQIPLNKLSLMPDIEDFIYPLYTFKFQLWENVNNLLKENFNLLLKETKNRKLIEKVKGLRKKEKELRNQMKKFYNSSFMGKYKTPGGLSVTVQNLNIKARANKELLLSLLDNEDNILDFDSCYLPEQFYNQWFSFCAGMRTKNIKMVLDFLNMDVNTDPFKLVEFLLLDTLFCLTQILEIVVPLKTTTLFTNYFIAETHEELLRINSIAEFIYFFYSYFETKNSELSIFHKEKINKRIIRFVNTRLRNIDSNQPDSRLSSESVRMRFKNKWNSLIEDENKLKNQEEIDFNYMDKIIDAWEKTTGEPSFKDVITNNIENINSERLYAELAKKIKRSNINYTVNVYLAENAIRYYIKAQELHSEGKAYKDKIRNLYFLDDDLNNDTCQFLFARERYLLNSGYIKERLKTLKTLYPKSPLYNVKNYVEELDK